MNDKVKDVWLDIGHVYKTTGKICIGWISVDEGGYPYQPSLGKGWRQRKKPITVYQSESRAATYSPVNKAKPVYV